MRVEAEAKRQYGEKPDVGRSTVFRKPLHEMLQSSTGVLEAWLEEVETAKRIEDQRKRNVVNSCNSIRQYMIKQPIEEDHKDWDSRSVRRRLLDTG